LPWPRPWPWPSCGDARASALPPSRTAAMAREKKRFILASPKKWMGHAWPSMTARHV